jgi:uncharacterized protein
MSIHLLTLRPYHVLKTILIAGLLLSVSACSSMGFKNVFSDYADQLKSVRSAQLNGDFKAAAAMIETPKSTQTNYALTLLEKGRLSFLAKDWTQSRKEFNLVSDALEQ